jgi:homoserine kinase type II
MTTGITEKIRRIVEDRYDLGEFIGAREIHGGTVNTSFHVRISGLQQKTKHYFLREYNPAARESEIRFEHALLSHLRNSGFELASIPIPGRDSTTYFQAPASSPILRVDNFWALFDFLKGEDKYSWIETDLIDEEVSSSADILGRLHHHGADFTKPANTDRAQPPIMHFLPILKHNFAAFAGTAQKSRCCELFKRHAHKIQSILDAGIAAPERHAGLLKLPIHCDYHPGNLKFENGKGVGLFDFDWSKIDYRVFDVALALFYFTAQWQGEGAGCLRLTPFRLFLKVYQETCTHLDRVGPMTPRELRAIVPMLAYANLYVLNWSVVDFSEKADADDNEYYTYIHHGIRVMEWIEANKKTLLDIVNTPKRTEDRVSEDRTQVKGKT